MEQRKHRYKNRNRWGVLKVNFNNLILTGCELVASGTLIYLFTKENKIAAWEQKQIKKIKRFIYNLIVKLEG